MYLVDFFNLNKSAMARFIISWRAEEYVFCFANVVAGNHLHPLIDAGRIIQHSIYPGAGLSFCLRELDLILFFKKIL